MYQYNSTKSVQLKPSLFFKHFYKLDKCTSAQKEQETRKQPKLKTDTKKETKIYFWTLFEVSFQLHTYNKLQKCLFLH